MLDTENQTIKEHKAELRDRIQLDAVIELKTIISSDEYPNEEKLRLMEARIDFKNTELQKLNEDIEKRYEGEPAVQQLTLC
ncbi:hypothetical protein LGQ02_06675 [Bacillus shivajii]|uniref:hypothetical protein n=1 Tax=Bacillus shivajii TaxID=1983719 RepID=UPI001CFC07DC|nr:hypothetical protein [Bacillus shivajii]UCZ54443.1 hypothetical protein LGQ02_06675 [Bacillus shivajii]